MRDQRAHARRLMREDAILSDESGSGRQPVVLLDISRLGIAFTSPKLLEGGARLRLQFSLPGNPDRHDTLVEVVHSTSSGVPSGFRVGARFIEIEPHTTALITEFATTAVHGERA